MGIINHCPCDCSGTLNYSMPNDFTVTANICPDCEDPVGSSVILSDSTNVVLFESTIVRPSSCVTGEGGTTLFASGEGISFDGAPVVFYIGLSKSISEDHFTLLYSRLTDDGSLDSSGLSRFVPDDTLITISTCNGE